ncbi:MAG: OmpA family protein [Proteobacteria bacterium]|nr:OmpA family protein [Pseudomonadota bacterium]MDA0952027.1 OmpA family protein [Pseudomonadota bacterium]
MTQMRHFVTVGTLAAALTLAAGSALGQTVIGDVSESGVTVNLGALDSLGPDTGGASSELYGSTLQQPATSTTGSVLLIAPPSGGSGTAVTPSSNGSDSVLLLDQPATQPAAASSTFVFPAVPETKPAVPEGASVVSSTQDDGATTTTTVTTVIAEPAPEPEPEPVAVIAPEVTSDDLAAASDDPFEQIDAMLNEPVEPETIVVPEPEMEMETTEVVSLPPSEVVSGDNLDLQILFDAGVDTMTEADQALLDQLAGRLSGNPDQRIQLRAYASSDDGTASAARRLALARALQVRAYLIENGVRSTRIDVRALGDKVEGGGPLDRIDIVLVEP